MLQERLATGAHGIRHMFVSHDQKGEGNVSRSVQRLGSQSNFFLPCRIICISPCTLLAIASSLLRSVHSEVHNDSQILDIVLIVILRLLIDT